MGYAVQEDCVGVAVESRGVFVTERTTCRDLIQMIVNIDRLPGSPEYYMLYEVGCELER